MWRHFGREWHHYKAATRLEIDECRNGVSILMTFLCCAQKTMVVSEGLEEILSNVQHGKKIK